MVIFGWLVLFGLTAFVWFATFAISFASVSLTSKIKEGIIPLVPALVLTWATWYNFPFVVGVK